MATIDLKIAQTEQPIGYTFETKLFCAEALQMAAAAVYLHVSGTRHVVKKNRDLEALGDTIIATILCTKWYNFQDARGTFHSHPGNVLTYSTKASASRSEPESPKSTSRI
jgi:hypothetical protein